MIPIPFLRPSKSRTKVILFHRKKHILVYKKITEKCVDKILAHFFIYCAGSENGNIKVLVLRPTYSESFLDSTNFDSGTRKPGTSGLFNYTKKYFVP